MGEKRWQNCLWNPTDSTKRWKKKKKMTRRERIGWFEWNSEILRPFYRGLSFIIIYSNFDTCRLSVVACRSHEDVPYGVKFTLWTNIVSSRNFHRCLFFLLLLAIMCLCRVSFIEVGIRSTMCKRKLIVTNRILSYRIIYILQFIYNTRIQWTIW